MSTVYTFRNRKLVVDGIQVGTGGITGPGAPTPATANIVQVREMEWDEAILDTTAKNIMPVNLGETIVSLVVTLESIAPGATVDIGINGALAGGAAEPDIIANNFETDEEFFNSAVVPACPINAMPSFDAAGYIILTSGGDYRASSTSANIKVKMFYFTS